MTEPNWLVHCLLLARVTPTVRLQRLRADVNFTLHIWNSTFRMFRIFWWQPNASARFIRVCSAYLTKLVWHILDLITFPLFVGKVRGASKILNSCYSTIPFIDNIFQSGTSKLLKTGKRITLFSFDSYMRHATIIIKHLWVNWWK